MPDVRGEAEGAGFDPGEEKVKIFLEVVFYYRVMENIDPKSSLFCPLTYGMSENFI